MPAFLIHPLTPADYPAILSVYRRCEDFLALGPVAQASAAMVQQDFETSQAAGGRYCGIFSPDGRLLGVLDYLSAGFKGDPAHAFIELLMIAQGERRQGLGQAVYEWAEAQIFADPAVAAIFLGVQVNNPGAQRFWQRCGFRQAGPPRLMPDRTTAVLLRKDRPVVDSP